MTVALLCSSICLVTVSRVKKGHVLKAFCLSECYFVRCDWNASENLFLNLQRTKLWNKGRITFKVAYFQSTFTCNIFVQKICNNMSFCNAYDDNKYFKVILTLYLARVEWGWLLKLAALTWEQSKPLNFSNKSALNL